MVRPLALLVWALAGIALAAGVAACGSDDEGGLLPPTSADAILTNLDRVERLAAEGRCQNAVQAAQQVIDQVQGLGPAVGPKLREALVDGSERLRLLVEDPGRCEEQPRETVPTETVPTEPEEEPTVPEEEDDDENGKGKGNKKDKDGGPGSEETTPPGSEGGGLTPPDAGPPGGVPPGQGGVPPGQAGGVDAGD